MKVLIVTDAFPPVCGGSGWSTYELARGLRLLGHTVAVVQPKPGAAEAVVTREYDGLTVAEFGTAAPPAPYVRNWFKNERLYRRLHAYLRDRIAGERFDLVHGQHVMTCLPAITAGHAAGVPAIATVRDYWPVCYWSDLIYSRDTLTLCPACTPGMMTRCVRPRAGAAWPLALPMIPYMRRNLARKRRGLAHADAVIAVSSTIASDLRARAPELEHTRLEVIPNPVDVTGLRRRAAAMTAPLDVPYALYLGKLAPNKGTDLLVPAVSKAGLDWPLVVAGDGPDRARMTDDAARLGVDVRFLGWLDPAAAMPWLRHASMLVFPSRGPESLSRVLIEASALGIPIAAMETGGTPDIIVSGETGLLSSTADEFARDIRTLRQDEALRARLGAAAARRAEGVFDARMTTARIEAVYRSLLEGRRR